MIKKVKDFFFRGNDLLRPVSHVLGKFEFTNECSTRSVHYRNLLNVVFISLPVSRSRFSERLQKVTHRGFFC